MIKYTHAQTSETKTHREWQNKLGISFHPDRPPGFLAPYQPSIQQLTPAQVLPRQQSTVRADAETAYRQPVTLTDGTTWNGGFDSASAINGADYQMFTVSSDLLKRPEISDNPESIIWPE